MAITYQQFVDDHLFETMIALEQLEDDAGSDEFVSLGENLLLDMARKDPDNENVENWTKEKIESYQHAAISIIRIAVMQLDRHESVENIFSQEEDLT